MVSVSGQRRWVLEVGFGRLMDVGLVLMGLLIGVGPAHAWEVSVAPLPAGERAELRVAWSGGASEDSPGLEGESLVFAQALFTGTQTRPGSSWMQALSSYGADLEVIGGDSATEVQVRFPEANLPQVLQLFGDALAQPGFQSRELLDLQDRMIRRLGEWSSSREWRVERGARSFLFGPGPFALPRGGSRESLLRISPQDLFARHTLWIHRGNLKVALRSSLGADEVRQALEVNWSSIPAGPAVQSRVILPQGDHRPWAVLHQDEGSDRSELSFYLPGLPFFSEKRAALEVVVSALSLASDSQFQSVLRNSYRSPVIPEVKILFGGPAAYEDRDSSVLLIRLGLDREVNPGLVARLWQTVTNWSSESLTPQQLEFGKDQVIQRYRALQAASLWMNLGALFAQLPSDPVPVLEGRIHQLNQAEIVALQTQIWASGYMGFAYSGPSQEMRPVLESIFGVDRLRLEGGLQ